MLISETQTTLARERTASEYRETVAECLATAQQMRRLTDFLLELARFDAGHEPLENEPVDLAIITQACIDHIWPLIQKRALKIHSDLSPAATRGDALRLGRLPPICWPMQFTTIDLKVKSMCAHV